jgi:proline dehydrogenase
MEQAMTVPTTQRRLRRVRRLASTILMPMVRYAAKSYVAGEKLEDAMRVGGELARRNIHCTVGYFNAEEEEDRGVAEQYAAAIETIRNDFSPPPKPSPCPLPEYRERVLKQLPRKKNADEGIGAADGYLSIKLPAIHYSWELLRDVACRAREANVRLHFDALEPETVEQTWELVDRLLGEAKRPAIGVTLPGRWRRSVRDAQWAAERGLMVRVVKGQWADPHEPGMDLREGYLRVIDALAGKAANVGVASHDVPMVERAVEKLRGSGTGCEIELLYGLPMRHSLASAARMKLSVRVYIPYGTSALPYAIGKVGSSPRLAWWLLKDFVTSLFMLSLIT